ncbi:MAG: hypothetical protein H6686_04470 [Fibrobacteria bacterium]|nr:hypothetical protein [Fibrobacteria bacterium]
MGNDPRRDLARQVEELRRQAEEVGAMVAGHRLLECPSCGLAEDALADLTVRVVLPERPDEDTGLRFSALDDDEATWSCPQCGTVFAPTDEPIS